MAGNGQGTLDGPAHRSTGLPYPARAVALPAGSRSFLAVRAAIIAPHAIEPARLQGALGCVLRALTLGQAKAHAPLVGAAFALGGLLVLAIAVQVYDVPHHASGPIIVLGSTMLSNSSPVTYPPLRASSFKVVPLLCAALASLAALS